MADHQNSSAGSDGCLSAEDREALDQVYISHLKKEIERLRDVAQPVPHPDLLASTVSCSGTEITIQCNNHGVKDRLMDFLTGDASQPSPAATVETRGSGVEMIDNLSPEALANWQDDGNCNAGRPQCSAATEDAGCGAAIITPWAVEEHPMSQGLLRTQEIMRTETMKTKIAALAHRFWNIRPSSLDDMGLTREEFYASEMTKLFGSLSATEPQAVPKRDDLARVIAGKIGCEADCQRNPSGCGCSDDAADAVMALLSPAMTRPQSRSGE